MTIEEKNVLPDSRQIPIMTPRNVTPIGGGSDFLVPIFCASCHCRGGSVSQENITFAFWLCQECFEKYGDLTEMYVMPDEVFWEKLKNAQLEKYGRTLSAEETLISLSDTESLESLFARDRARLTPQAGA